MKSTSEIHLSISDQWNPPISDKWNPPDYQWNPPVNPPVYQWNPPISQIHLSVKSTYQWNPPISQVYQWNPPISQIYLSVKSTCLSVKFIYQSDLPISQIHLFISQIHLSISQIYLSVKSTYQSNHLSVKSTYQSNLPVKISLSTFCLRGSHKKTSERYRTCCQKPSNRHRVFFSPKQLPTLTHTKKGVQITQPLMFLYTARSAQWHTANGWHRKHKAWLRTLAETN